MASMNSDDAELISRAENGERPAFDTLVERYFNDVMAVAYAALGDKEIAREVAQDTFTDAFKSLRELREKNKFAPWLIGIARRKAHYSLRRKRKDREVMQIRKESVRVLPPETPAEAAMRRERSGEILNAVTELQPKYREVIILRYLNDRTHEDIANLLNLSLAAVDKRLMRAKEKLRGMIRREEESE